MGIVDSLVSQQQRLNPGAIVVEGNEGYYGAVYSRVPLEELKLPEGYYVDDSGEFILNRGNVKGGQYTLLIVRPYKAKVEKDEERLAARREAAPETGSRKPTKSRNVLAELYKRYSEDEPTFEPVPVPVKPVPKPELPSTSEVPKLPTIAELERKIPIDVSGNVATYDVIIALDYAGNFRPIRDEYDDLENIFVEMRDAAATPFQMVSYDRSRAIVKAASTFNAKLRIVLADFGKITFYYRFPDAKSYQEFMKEFPGMLLGSAMTLDQAKDKFEKEGLAKPNTATYEENGLRFFVNKDDFTCKVALASTIKLSPSVVPVKASPAFYKMKRKQTLVLMESLLYRKAAALLRGAMRFTKNEIKNDLEDGKLVFTFKFDNEKQMQEFLKNISSWVRYFEDKIDDPSFEEGSQGLVLK